jgi:tryptophanyl-tRNA synthetase
MARDLANRFNHLYGTDLTEPQAMIEDHVATLPGLDGRKMSKSYDNTIALFAAPAQLRKQIMGLITDSRLPGEPKDTEGSALFQLYQAFATPEQTQAMRQAFVQGIAWADAKGQLFDCIDQSIAPMRSAYEQYMANPAQIEAILQAGAQKARAVATPTMQRLRHAVGLRTLSSSVNANAAPMPQTKLALPSFKQYREADGQFYFKLHSGQGVLMIQSPAYAQPKDCGQAIAQLQQHGSGVLAHLGLVLAPAMQADVLDAELAAWRSAKAKP